VRIHHRPGKGHVLSLQSWEGVALGNAQFVLQTAGIVRRVFKKKKRDFSALSFDFLMNSPD
jgi:hypothetical protein